jgi:hypothetical protein
MIADSLRQVGAARSIVIDERGLILAGNATVEAAAAAESAQASSEPACRGRTPLSPAV